MSAPTPIRSVSMAAERSHLCMCGVSFTQIREAGKRAAAWMPLTCDKCRDEVRARRAELDAEVAAAEIDRRTSAILASLPVPPIYAPASLETFNVHGDATDQLYQRRAIATVVGYLRSWPAVDTLLVFRGAPGTGKGHLVWSIAKALAGRGERCRVVKLADMIRELRASWRDRAAEDEAVTLARYRDVPLLVIDEVSRHAFYGQQIHQHLYDVLDHRIEQQRPTILTSNEDDTGIAEILRPALFDRLLGSGGVVEFGQASWRARPR